MTDLEKDVERVRAQWRNQLPNQGTANIVLMAYDAIKAERDQQRLVADRLRVSWNEDVAEARKERDVALAQRDRLEKALMDLAEHGLRADTNPTRTGQTDDEWWDFLIQYLDDADSYVRELAKSALAGMGEKP